MCYRYSLVAKAGVLTDLTGADFPDPIEPRYNIGPTENIWTVRSVSEGRRADRLHWGLLPGWMKRRPDPEILLANARAETLGTKPAFRDAYRNRRCLIPATGFYEWKPIAGHKQPHLFTLRQHEPFCFAGLWERWTDPGNGKPVESCTVITTEPNELMRPIHDRMPAILEPDFYERWLDPELTDPAALHFFLQPIEPERMHVRPVSTYVNNVRNEGPECHAPPAPARGPPDLHRPPREPGPPSSGQLNLELD